MHRIDTPPATVDHKFTEAVRLEACRPSRRQCPDLQFVVRSGRGCARSNHHSVWVDDWSQNIAPATFEATIDKMASTMRAAGSGVALRVPFSPAGAKTYAWIEYRKAIKRVAVKHGAPVCDVMALLGTSPDAAWLRDTLHLNHRGYGEVALLVERLLRM